MGRFQRILYVERRRRGSTRAFSCAIHTALREGASLTVAGAATGDRLERMAELGSLFGVPVRRVELDRGGLPADLVSGHDLVITVGRSKGPVWPFRPGGLERRLMRECGCPAWILHPAQSPESRVVVAAVDVTSRAGEALSRGVLEAAGGLADSTGAELHVVHCWSVVGESLLASRSRGGSRRGAERVLTEAARSRRRRIEGLLEAAGLGGVGRVVLCKQKVVPGLRDVAWRLEADIVVVGSVGRTGVGALFPGNTAERLVGRVPASLFVVPADWAQAADPSPSLRRAASRSRPAVDHPWPGPGGVGWPAASRGAGRG